MQTRRSPAPVQRQGHLPGSRLLPVAASAPGLPQACGGGVGLIGQVVQRQRQQLRRHLPIASAGQQRWPPAQPQPGPGGGVGVRGSVQGGCQAGHACAGQRWPVGVQAQQQPIQRGINTGIHSGINSGINSGICAGGRAGNTRAQRIAQIRQQPAPGIGPAGQAAQQVSGGSGCGQELLKRLGQRPAVGGIGPPEQRTGARKVAQQLGRALVGGGGLGGLRQAAGQGHAETFGSGGSQFGGNGPGQRAQVDLQLVDAQQLARRSQRVAGSFNHGQQAGQVEALQRVSQRLGVLTAAALQLQHLAQDAVLLCAGHHPPR